MEHEQDQIRDLKRHLVEMQDAVMNDPKPNFETAAKVLRGTILTWRYLNWRESEL